MNRLHPRTVLRSPFGRSLAQIMVAFTLIPIVVLTALSLYTVQTQLRDRSLAQAGTVAGLVQQATTQWIAEASAELASRLQNAAIVQNSSFILMAADTDVSRAEQVLSKDLATLASGAYLSRAFLVRRDDSVALASQPEFKGQKLGIGLAALHESGKRAWGFGPSSLLGDRAALVWQPIVDQRQEVVGFLVGQINVQELAAIFKKNAVGLGQTGEVYLINQQQIPLTALTSANDATQAKLSLNPAIISDRPYSDLFVDYAGQPVVGTVQALDAPLTGWLVVHQQQSEAFDTFYTLIRTGLALALLLVALAILASILTAERIIDPLQRLSGAARSMAAGKLATRVNVPRRDEFGVLAASFNSMASELGRAFSELEGSNRKLGARAEQLAAITRVSQHATSFLDMNQLLPTLTREIQQAFNYYSVALFLADEEASTLVAQAVVGASTDGTALGLTTRTVPVELQIGSTSLVGTAASLRRVINVPDVSIDNRYLPDPLCPETRSEVSIPLMMGQNKLIGVLDIQSNKLNAFSQDEVDILQILANQIAIAIRNADLFRETEQARRAADEANRLKSEFLSNMSHELRTPLNVIIGYSHSILNRPAMYDHVALPSVYESGVRSIMSSGEHLLGLINDVLDLSKIEAGHIDLKIESVDPLPILQGVRQTGLGLIKSGVQLRANYAEKLPRITGDELRIRQILLNLVSNAAKFTANGFITLDARVQGEHLLFSVADTGMGIPEAARPLIFERFRQADSDVVKKHGGSGLGLSISRQLCLMQNGEIWFESQEGKGTTFYFTIPLAKEQKETGGITPAPASGGAEISARAEIFAPVAALAEQALLIDTNSTSSAALRKILAEVGYDVLVSDQAQQGIELAEAVLPNLLVIHVHKDDPAEMQTLAEKCRNHSELTKLAIVELHDLQDFADPNTALKQCFIDKTIDKAIGIAKVQEEPLHREHLVS
jgi:signal transduction histidine kinase/HAMP domain-containing protein